MIEHVSYEAGLFMLSEAFRVLKPGGIVRISTPNLAFLIELYSNTKSELQQKYIRWSSDTFLENVSYYKDAFVINNYFRNWGHQFIYDEQVLRASLQKAGFESVKRFPLQQSDSACLRSLENEHRMPISQFGKSHFGRREGAVSELS